MPVSEIEPGMRGIGKTVFAGDKIEEFDFEVLDILPNFRSKQDLILVKLDGEKVEHTNVVAGMSGSPMYIDGKLVGALSYRMGVFLKDPIAGITPIRQMLDILDHEKTREAELAFNRGFNADYLDMAVGVKPATFAALTPPAVRATQSAAAVQPQIRALEVPLLFSGFEETALRSASELFSGAGFKVYSGGSVSSVASSESTPLKPGDPYAVVLVDGDLGLQATGTVTYTDNGRILGMGHPFFNFGAVGLPMGKAKIVTTISSLMASTKLSALTEVVGTVHQDRTSGVMGVEGEIPRMIPVSLNVKSSFGEVNEFRFRVAEDRSLYSLTPLILGVVISNALESARMSVGNQTLKLDGAIRLKGHDPIPLQNFYAGSTPSGFQTDAVQATGAVAATLGSILSNNFENPDIESIELNFEALPRKQLAIIQRIEVDKTVVRPGMKVRLVAYVKEYQGAAHKVSHSLVLPATLDARKISIYVGSGATLTRLEARTTPQRFRPKNFEQLVELLNEQRKNNYVFFQVRQPDRGVLVDGRELPGLPPSVLSVIRQQKSSGTNTNLRDRVLVEESVQTQYAVTGGRNVWLRVEHKK